MKGTDMDENDTTAIVDTQAAVEQTQPAADVSTDAPAATADTEPSEPSQDEQADQPTAPEVDDKLQKFAASQGIELDSPNAIKAAQALQKARSEATRNYRKANELEKGMTEMGDVSAQREAEATGQDPELLKRLQRMEIKDSIRDFYTRNPDAPQYEDRMNELAQTSGLYGTPEAILKAAYAMAKAEAPDNSEAVTSQVKKDTLKNLASKQNAAVPAGHATTSSPAKEKSAQDMTPAEIEKKYGSVRY